MFSRSLSLARLTRLGAWFPALLLSAGLGQAAPLVTYEKAGVTGPDKAAICAGMGGVSCLVGTESFTGRPSMKGFTADFGIAGNVITGTYSAATLINSADRYGAAGGTGNYAATFSKTGYSLDLKTTLPSGINYFGFYLSALDKGNVVNFYDDGKQVFSFTPGDFIKTVAGCPSDFCGNPDAPFKGLNKGEPYAYLNFFFGDQKINKVEFKENPQVGGYESDNHTVGYVTATSGDKVPVAVPAPAALGSFLAGLAGLALARRRRNTAKA